MFEWNEKKRLQTLHERHLDFRDAYQIFDGRPIIHLKARRNEEGRFVSTAEINAKLFTVVWTWRGKNQRIISFRRARNDERRIGQCTAKLAAAHHKAGGSAWAKAAAMTNKELEASIAADRDEAGMVMDWDSVTVELPKPKADLHMRVDRDVLDFFRRTGKGYQTRINAVLRSYVLRALRN